MPKTLDEFFASYESTQFLISNLEENMEVLGGDLAEEDRKALTRLNLIMIRQCLNSFGVE